MEIKHFNLQREFKQENPIVACIGYFDGLHLGHQKLASCVLDSAKEKGVAAAIITFSPDPRQVLTHKEYQHLQTFAQRLTLFADYGFDLAIVLDFDETMASLSKEAFLKQILLKMNLVGLVCGFDFHYAQNGAGNYRTLAADCQKYFPLQVIASVDYAGSKISTSRIKDALKAGDLPLANALLGYTYHLIAHVIHGRGIGHMIGFATANLAYSPEVYLPQNGVYLGYAAYEGKLYRAMINVGKNPTVSNDEKITVEVHLLDFKADLYDRELTVYFLLRLRETIRFASLKDLAAQLALDAAALRSLNERPRYFL